MVSSVMTGAAVPDVPRSTTSGVNPWILNPLLDFMFVFGGFVWVCIGLTWLTVGMQSPDLSHGKYLFIIAMLGQRLIADPHNTATYFRIYANAESRKRFHFYCYVLPLLVAPLFFLGICIPAFAGTMGLIYSLWVFQHYAAQTFGISLVYCYKQGYQLKPFEREAFRYFVYSMVALTISKMLTFAENSPKDMIGVPCPFWGPLPDFIFYTCRILAVLLSVFFVLVIVRKFLVEGKLIPLPALVAIITVVALGFWSGPMYGVLWLFAPAFFHGSQYIAISLAYYLKERGLPENVSCRQIASVLRTMPALKYLGILILSGTTMYLGIPTICSQIGFDYSVVTLTVLCVVNFHHFITDAAIWKLRDKKCREILLA